MAQIILVFSLLFSTVEAFSKCLSASTCVGQDVYIYDSQKLFSDVLMDIDSTHVYLYHSMRKRGYLHQNVARKDASTCTQDTDGQKICPGALVEGGQILAVFPTGYVVFEDPAGNVTAAPGENYRKRADGETKLTALSATKKSKDQGKAPSEERVAYFKNLLQRAQTAPIEDFLELWFPEDVAPYTEGYIERCFNFRDTNYQNNFYSDCNPDVLYSWGPEIKLKKIVLELKDEYIWGSKLNGTRGVWATISPVSSYAYGPIPIRLKLKKSAKFSETGSSWTITNFAARGVLVDYFIPASSTLESISYGTPEHYDEIVKDIKRISSGKKALTYGNALVEKVGMQTLYEGGIQETGPQNEATLRARLALMIEMILDGRGEVIYAPGVPRDRAQHFHTDRPTYFNER